jgi:hypothetical protein
MPFFNVSDARFVFQYFSSYRKVAGRRERQRWKPVVKVLGAHSTMWASVEITGPASKENITLYGRRKNTKKSIVDVFPDKTRKSGR